MTPVFVVKTSPYFERLSKKLSKQNRTFRRILYEAISILESDPYNHSRRHAIKKLSGPQEEGQTAEHRKVALSL